MVASLSGPVEIMSMEHPIKSSVIIFFNVVFHNLKYSVIISGVVCGGVGVSGNMN